jgi:UDP-galactopyranose mutase
MRKKPILIVGAGLSGATVARQLADNGISVTIVDRRQHIAGNAYDYVDTNGIRIHKYGPHIFHTNNEEVVAYLSKFTQWIPYQHRVKAMLSTGELVTMPPNRSTASIIGSSKLIDTLYRPYSKKMWGMELEQLSPSILARVPVREDDNELYFPDDRFQYMPKNGYTRMVENMLDHNLIQLNLGEQFSGMNEAEYEHIFNSMPIDEYFDFSDGELPYRSIRFSTVSLPAPRILPVATVNFTHSGSETRITEWKNFPGHGENHRITVLTYEEPCDYKDNNRERYYPVKDVKGLNRILYKQYSSRVGDHMTFIGRCGLYVYLDMHQAVSAALSTAKKYLAERMPS